MTSTKQIQSNRENALKGGVKTPEGKTITRMNAVKHGMLGNLILENEKAFVQETQAKLIEYFKPSNFIEEIIIDRLTICLLRLKRGNSAETELFLSIYNPKLFIKSDFPTVNEQTEKIVMGIEEIIQEGYVPSVSPGVIDTIVNTHQRYESNLERSFFRLLRELSFMRQDKTATSVANTDDDETGFVSQKGDS